MNSINRRKFLAKGTLAIIATLFFFASLKNISLGFWRNTLKII